MICNLGCQVHQLRAIEVDTIEILKIRIATLSIRAEEVDLLIIQVNLLYLQHRPVTFGDAPLQRACL